MFVLAHRLMRPCARFTLLGAVLSSSALARPASDTRSATPDLVVLADPSPPSDLAKGPGPVTLPYRVREIFAGEPGASSVIVTHAALDATERSRLASSERVILLARRDPAHEGRWTAPAPLIATPRAIAAFREWSAPTDVRPARPLADVLAAARDVTIAPKGERPPDPPARAAGDREPVTTVPIEQDGPPRDLLERPTTTTSAEVTDEVVAPRETWPPARETPPRACRPARSRPDAPPRAPSPTLAPPPAPERASRAAAAAEPAADLPRYEESVTVKPRRSPPYTFPHLLVPQPGPGLPPPPEATVLGPPMEARRDLHVPEGLQRERTRPGL